MEGGYARGVRQQAARQARAMVELLGHHPSIVDVVRARRAARRRHARTRGRERDGADVGQGGARPVDRARDRARPTAPARSSAAPAPATTRTSGSAGGTARSPASRPRVRAVPRLGRFVSAFGAQSVPDDRRLDAPRAVAATSTWDDLAEHHGMERARVRRARPAADAKSFDEWCDATQAYQAALAAAPDRGPPPLQGHAVRRVRGVLPRRPVAGGRVRAARPRPRSEARVRRGARRVPAGARDGRPANRQRPRGERHPPARSPTPRSWSRSTAGSGSGAATSPPTRSRSSAPPTSTTRSTSRSCSRHPDVGRVANRYPLVILEAGRRVGDGSAERPEGSGARSRPIVMLTRRDR